MDSSRIVLASFGVAIGIVLALGLLGNSIVSAPLPRLSNLASSTLTMPADTPRAMLDLLGSASAEHPESGYNGNLHTGA